MTERENIIQLVSKIQSVFGDNVFSISSLHRSGIMLDENDIMHIQLFGFLKQTSVGPYGGWKIIKNPKSIKQI
jgi:hypothetical protein